MNKMRGINRLLKLFSSAVIDQALLSGASLCVGLILIRRSTDLQYGYYILAINALLLLTSLQSAFFAPSMVKRLTHLNREGRADVVGGLYRAQRHMLIPACVGAMLVTAVLWCGGVLDRHSGPLVFAVIGAALLTLNREYFRMVLLAYHRPADVLRSDAVFVALLIPAAFLATWFSAPSLGAILGLTLSALVGGLLLAGFLRRHEPWNISGSQGILRQIAPFALWSTAGAAVHWTFSQGYSYLVAATLDVQALASIAATRLLMMPVNLLSTGLGTMMLPLATTWLAAHGAPTVLRRLSFFAAAVAGIALCYFGGLWLFRDWIFATILKKSFAHRDQLLLLWFSAFLVMVIRDQLIYLLVVHSRFRVLTAITAASALASLMASYWAMRHIGEIGAPLGVLLGEIISVCGILALSLRESNAPLAIPG